MIALLLCSFAQDSDTLTQKGEPATKLEQIEQHMAKTEETIDKLLLMVKEKADAKAQQRAETMAVVPYADQETQQVATVLECLDECLQVTEEEAAAEETADTHEPDEDTNFDIVDEQTVQLPTKD